MSVYVFPALATSHYNDEQAKSKRISKEPLSLVEFSNGNIKSPNSICFESYKSEDEQYLRNKTKRIMVASTNNLQYSAQNFDEYKSDRTLCLLKVGILNKNTKAMRLYDADLFHFKPLIKFKAPTQNMDLEGTFLQKVDNLTCAFGSKIKRKATESRIKYTPNENQLKAVAEAIDDSIMEKITQPTEPLKIDPKTEAIPPQNKDARSVVEVYNIYDIISEEEYDAIVSEEDTFLSATHQDVEKWKNDNVYCDFIITFVKTKIRCLTSQTARLLCYFHYMICFLRLCYKDLQKKDPVPHVPEPFKQKLMDKFVLSSNADGIKRSMPQKMKDKLMAYAIVLALYIDNFNVDAMLLSTSFKIAITRVTNIAYSLGCHVTKQRETSKMFQLKLPLYVHDESSFKRRKKN